MERDKEHFHHLLLYCFDSKNGSNLTDSFQKLILSLLHQLKYVNIDLDDSKVMIFI